MSDPVETLRNSYPNMTAGQALFFQYGDHAPAARVEAPLIGLEFTDGAYIGTDPAGFLFYRNLDDFDVSGDHKRPSHYTVSIVTYNSKNYALVQFYHVDVSNCYAQFIAEDPKNAVENAKMAGYTNDGNWNKLKIGSATATVSKDSDDPTITIYVDTIHMNAVWQAAQSQPLIDASFEVQGTIYFKDINTIVQGIYVGYSNDRLVFYQDYYTGTDFMAYFIPLEDQAENLAYSGASGGLQLEGVAWNSTNA